MNFRRNSESGREAYRAQGALASIGRSTPQTTRRSIESSGYLFGALPKRLELVDSRRGRHLLPLTGVSVRPALLATLERLAAEGNDLFLSTASRIVERTTFRQRIGESFRISLPSATLS